MFISGVKKFLKKYFDPDLDLRVQIFNLMAYIGIAAGIGTAAIAAVMKDSAVIVLIDLAVALLSIILLRVADKKKCYHLCSWVLVATVFFVFFPALFFACGGNSSGAAYSFIIAFVFTAVLLEGYERTAALVFEFILYTSCLLIVFYRPEIVAALPSEFDNLLFTALNLTTTCAILMAVLLFRTRMFNNRQGQIEELNRELTARNETLAQYDMMKSDFLATVAHEINTPLAVIAASSNDTIDLLKESPLNIDEIVNNQMVIERRIKLIDSILLDLMDIAAIESGRLSLNRQPIYMADLLKSICGENICDARLGRMDVNNNTITLDIQPDLQRIWADPQRIEQVMTNLLSNACRHTKDGVITVKLAQAESNQVVSVIDNGEGMDKETAQVVLRQYVSTKADYWRHGIGLSICRRIIVAHGGEIWVDSKKGRGTIASFSLREDAGYE